MKNLKVSQKLIIGFLIAIILTAIVGAVGIYGLLTSSAASSRMYDYNVVPLPSLSKVAENVHELRIYTREYALAIINEDPAGLQVAKSNIDDVRIEMKDSLNAFDAAVDDPKIQVAFDSVRSLIDKEYLSYLDRIHGIAMTGDHMAVIAEIQRATPTIYEIISGVDRLMEMETEDAYKADLANDSMTTILLTVIIAVLVVSIAISIFMALYISGLISKPLIVLSAFMKRAGTTGDITLSPAESESIGKYSQIKDEIGQALDGSAAFVRHVTTIAGELEVVAGGDLTADIILLSDVDTMGKSLKKMVENLSHMFVEIQASTNQVSSGSRQVADGAQSLAQGATEQAASIQELSSSIAEIAERTRENAATADKTAALSATIKENAEKGSRQMDDMITAVSEINEASKGISKIIKTIDDIAFQTNILALNAAVEAARAGQHGKGFAVVAEEVRNLASKSAEAARDTGNMIQNSMEKAQLGSRIAGETATSLNDIVTGINESGHLVAEIASASEQQSTAISQINTGIEQVAQVVQQNSATAEQSAAASEEMSGQSDNLQQLIAQFRLKDSGGQRSSLPAAEHSTQRRLGISKRSEHSPPEDAADFGKY